MEMRDYIPTEYPKWVDGVVVQNAAEESAHRTEPPKSAGAARPLSLAGIRMRRTRKRRREGQLSIRCDVSTVQIETLARSGFTGPCPGERCGRGRARRSSYRRFGGNQSRPPGPSPVSSRPCRAFRFTASECYSSDTLDAPFPTAICWLSYEIRPCTVASAIDCGQAACRSGRQSASPSKSRGKYGFKCL